MNIGRITLALAIVAATGPVASELRAQEFDLPPVPSSSTEKNGTAFAPENGPCFYNAYSWMMRGRLNQSLIAGEMQDLAALGTSPGSGCLGHYAVTSYDLYGPWAYMLIDGVRQPERVSQARVKAVWDASRKAAAEKEAKERIGHVWVPTIGNGHGSDVALESQTVVFRVAPRPTPNSYNGIPIIERNRSWERFETTDGQRVWRQVSVENDSYGRRPGAQRGNDLNARFGSRAGDRRIQKQEGLSLSRSPGASRSVDRSPGSSVASSSSSSRATTRAPRGKSTVKQ
jgi:hypothetical protein